jgi:hypothetical protein
MRVVFLALSICSVACAETDARIIDVEGPRGWVEGPGPWALQVLTDGPAPTLQLDPGDGAFRALPLGAQGDGLYVGEIPDRPVGTSLRYYAELQGDVTPSASRPWQVLVVPALEAPLPPPAPGRCALRFRWPLAGAAVDRRADSAPQSGLQLVVVVDTNLPDGAAARLLVEGVGYAGRAGSGVVAFEAVTLPEGDVELVVDAAVAGGAPCEDRVAVRVSSN